MARNDLQQGANSIRIPHLHKQVKPQGLEHPVTKPCTSNHSDRSNKASYTPHALSPRSNPVPVFSLAIIRLHFAIGHAIARGLFLKRGAHELWLTLYSFQGGCHTGFGHLLGSRFSTCALNWSLDPAALSARLPGAFGTSGAAAWWITSSLPGPDAAPDTGAGFAPDVLGTAVSAGAPANLRTSAL